MKRLLLFFALAGSAAAQIVPSAPVTANPNTGVLRTPTTLSAPAWLLSGNGALDTLTPSQVGFGWTDGRATIQTPAGSLQFYLTGTPQVPVIYWPGRIVTNTLESAGTFVGSVGAGSINRGVGGVESISADVIGASLAQNLTDFGGYQQTNRFPIGIPTQADAQGFGGTLELVDGIYFPQSVVSDASTTTSVLSGRHRTLALFLTDLGRTTATATLDFPSIAAGAQANLTITLTGAAVGDAIYLGLPASPAAGLVFNAFVSAADTVTVRASNISGAAVDAPSGTYRVTRF